MRILALETSCDETGAAIVERNDHEQFVKVLSNVTATSLAIHAKTGGIIPENAAREQVKFMIPTIKQCLREANLTIKNDIDAIAVTYGPGLIGSLLVGVETAKTLSFVFSKPIIPVHHLLAHLFANFIQTTNIRKRKGSKLDNLEGGLASHLIFPFVGLIVSGGHTDLLLFNSLTNYKWLGGTRDDAAGEALDKIGRLLNLPYPAGPEIEQRANEARKSSIKFKSPLVDIKTFDFSFSGLKTEVGRFVKGKNLTDRLTNEICRAVQDAIFDVLVKKTIRAAKMFGTKQILLGGGVSSNQTLRTEFEKSVISNKLQVRIFSPEKKFATDNAAMIGAYALLDYKPIDWSKITAEPDLYFD